MTSVPLHHQVAMVLLFAAMGFCWAWLNQRITRQRMASRVTYFFMWFYFLMASFLAIKTCWSVVYPHA